MTISGYMLSNEVMENGTYGADLHADDTLQNFRPEMINHLRLRIVPISNNIVRIKVSKSRI